MSQFYNIINSNLIKLNNEDNSEKFNSLNYLDKISDSIFSESEDIKVIIHAMDTNKLNAYYHDFFEIMYVYKGSCINGINGNSFKMNEGDICILGMNDSHYVKVDCEGDILINILIKKSLFDKSFLSLLSENNLLTNFFITSLFALKDEQHYLYFPGENSKSAQVLIQQLVVEYFNKKVCYKKSMECYLALVFSDLLRSYQSSIDKDNYKNMGNNHLSDILTYINDNKSTVTLSSVSKHFNYHPNYLSSLIKKYTNKSFSDILQEVRLSEACDYLVNTDLCIDNIVTLLGYYDRSYFYKVFKKQYNMTPIEYRNNRDKIK